LQFNVISARLWPARLAAAALMAAGCKRVPRGMTLVELVVVVAVVTILLALATPAYQRYLLRVRRSQAIGLLLQASMCQERVHASQGSYDPSLCQPASAQAHYHLAYSQAGSDRYQLTATPQGVQADDPCGSLWMNESGARGVSAGGVNSVKCWSGR
jgi:type IV pilus assembly protein PilE